MGVGYSPHYLIDSVVSEGKKDLVTLHGASPMASA